MRRNHLAELLRSFRPDDDLEAAYAERMAALLQVTGDPFSRAHFQPGHFTASSFVLNPARDAVLLIFHSKLLRWLQPGGHVDPQDVDILASARREVAEELSIDQLTLVGNGLFDIDIHEIPARRTEPTHAHFDVRFLFVAPNLDYSAGSDASAARWVPILQVSEVESDASVMRAIGKISR